MTLKELTSILILFAYLRSCTYLDAKKKDLKNSFYHSVFYSSPFHCLYTPFVNQLTDLHQ